MFLDRVVVDEDLQQAKAEEHRENELDEHPLVERRQGIAAAGHQRHRLPVEEVQDEVTDGCTAGLSSRRVGAAESVHTLRSRRQELGDARS